MSFYWVVKKAPVFILFPVLNRHLKLNLHKIIYYFKKKRLLLPHKF